MAEPTTAIAFGDSNRAFQAGIINGDVHHHAVPEQAETPPSPCDNIPFRRDTDFVDRGTLLDQVNTKCAVPGSWTALVGLGGVGKSQLAIEYCYRVRERPIETWVLWAHASNAARLEQSYRDIADRLKVRGRGDLRANIFKLVHDWLCDSARGKWILVLDNVDDASFLLAGKQGLEHNTDSRDLRPLLTYVPRTQNGSILITTRTRAAALELVEENDIVTVSPMDELDALVLLEKKLKMHNNADGVGELAAALEFMPLAIVQAATYITQLAPRCSVRQYLEEFQRSDREKTGLLDYEAGQLRRDREAKNSIIITWQISFDHIRRIRPSAAELLSLMSFFDRQGIPEALLRRREEVGEVSKMPHRHEPLRLNHLKRLFRRDRDRGRPKSQGKCEASGSWVDGFEDDLQVLRSYSFVAVGERGATFEMHALVQLAMRQWLGVNGQLERWKQQYITALNLAFPDGEYENWGRCEALFPHAKSALVQQPKEDVALCEWASLLYKGARYAWEKGSLTDAEKMAIASMQARSRVLGKKHKKTLESLGMVGIAYSYNGRWKEAEELQVQVMETAKKVFGDEDLLTLVSMANLALTYSDQGRWKEAEDLFVQLTKAFTKVLGKEHPSTLISMGSLAFTFRKQGRLKEAEELQIEQLEICSRVLGDKHLETLTSIGYLALIYSDQGRWKEAEKLQTKELEICSRVLGDEHPETLVSMNNLALVLRGCGHQEKAILVMKECCQLREQILGPQHPYTITSLKTLHRWRRQDAHVDV